MKQSLRIVALGLALVSSVAYGQETPDMLFQSAQYAETVRGDLQVALQMYQQVVTHPETPPSLAARALLQMGSCYEKLGDPRATEIYRRIVGDYPNQTDFAALARSRLTALAAARDEVHPLVRWYFQRTGIDPYVSTSYDGTMQAYTDWRTGNLMIRELSSGIVSCLTDTEWGRSASYAFHPAWSRDGRFLAYAWYTGFFASELRYADLETGETRVIWDSPDCLIYPQDWSPDGTILLAETYDFRLDPPKRMASINLETGERKELLSLDINARGFRFSPDGRWIAFDSMENQHRHIYLFSRETRKVTRLTSGSYGVRGFDNPVWSHEGDRILFRSIRSSQYDLWAVDINREENDGSIQLIQEDLIRALLIMKSIENHHLNEPKRPSPRSGNIHVLSAPFVDHFDSDTLSAPWNVMEWPGPNVYGNASFGHWSLREHPGFLRYWLDPMMIPRHHAAYLPNFRFWYWYYPATEIGLYVSGTRWELETRVIYTINDGTNSQNVTMTLIFDIDRRDGCVLRITRFTNVQPISALEAVLYNEDRKIAEGTMRFVLPDSAKKGSGPFTFRILRDGRNVRVMIQEEESAFKPFLEGSLPPSIDNQIQRLLINGECWFVPAGARADFDYVRFRPLEPDERMDVSGPPA